MSLSDIIASIDLAIIDAEKRQNSNCYNFCLNCQTDYKGISIPVSCLNAKHTTFHHCIEGGSLEELKDILNFVNDTFVLKLTNPSLTFEWNKITSHDFK